MGDNLFIILTDTNFDQETFESSELTVVFFGAERCSVCKELQPIVEEIAEEYAGGLKFCWVDVDRYKSLQKRNRLRGIPTLIIFKDGEVQEKIGGLRSKEELRSSIVKYI